MIDPKTANAAHVRTALLVTICFLLGLAVGAWWIHRSANREPVREAETEFRLTDSTRDILRQLESPIELRFYAILDAATAPDGLRAFAARVDGLLAAYEREAGDKLTVVRRNALSDVAVAATDGLKAFNLDRGDPCFLGVAVAGPNQKETLERLSPDWESALESDLSRAIARVAAARVVTRAPVTAAVLPDASVIEEVRRAIPNLDSVSVAEGTELLRAAALKQFTEAAEETDRRVKEVQQRIKQAQAAGAEAELQAAVKELQQVRAEQSSRLKNITARLQDQLVALQRIKEK